MFCISRLAFLRITFIDICTVAIKNIKNMHVVWINQIFCILTISISYCTVLRTIWSIFSEFFIICRLISLPFRWMKIFENRKIIKKKYIKIKKEENICQYCTRQRVITTLYLNACLTKMYQELSYLDLLPVSGLLNII